GVADCQQHWTEDAADEAEAEDAADEPEEGERHGQVAGLTQEMGPEDIVDAADEEQTPCRDEDAPPNDTLDKDEGYHSTQISPEAHRPFDQREAAFPW